LNVEVELNFPATLDNEQITDISREQMKLENEPLQPAVEPNDTTAELEGRT